MLNNLAQIYEVESKLRDAEAIYRQVLAQTYPQSPPKIVSGRSADTT